MELGFDDVVAVIRSFAERVRRQEAQLNAINVFPVADNDTGTNMRRTLDDIVAALELVDDLDSARRAVSDAALGGRGNSGLIVGQFLTGFVSVGSGDRLELATGCRNAATFARQSVARPVEGTMLTVADAAAGAAIDMMLGGEAAGDASVLASVASAAVAETPKQLAVLAERGVVDAGAAGLGLFYQALAELGDGCIPTALISGHVAVGAPSGRSDPGSVVGHEVQFRVPAEVIDSGQLQRFLGAIGTDVVVANSVGLLAAHVHVADPDVATAAISAELEGRRSARAISFKIEPIVVRGER